MSFNNIAIFLFILNNTILYYFDNMHALDLELTVLPFLNYIYLLFFNVLI